MPEELPKKPEQPQIDPDRLEERSKKEDVPYNWETVDTSTTSIVKKSERNEQKSNDQPNDNE